MLGLFKKKGQTIVAAVSGDLIPLESVADEVFSQKMMGDGYAIQPQAGEIFAPVTGKISTVFPTKHAIGITTEKGLEVLVHMGLDTVELDGAPFDVDVALDDAVTAGTKLATMDIAQVKASGREPTVVVVYTNMDQLKDYPAIEARQIQHGTEIGRLIYQ
ncbi:PTS glucose transporter subunit IIA [Lacticaseibacillus baoqingensis]|uniref:PTS glucose transporter subunit IIA n=1 Tax=Lacticaseibacillus baoqingensis TaxID=2486013 RepID=A0ABW4E7C2_9LACO|nr:PTS glucose transporter subunit IIA [Lacticaseibacillus baoqingensis]